jgi:hypothetical protein
MDKTEKKTTNGRIKIASINIIITYTFSLFPPFSSLCCLYMMWQENIENNKKRTNSKLIKLSFKYNKFEQVGTTIKQQQTRWERDTESNLIKY